VSSPLEGRENNLKLWKQSEKEMLDPLERNEVNLSALEGRKERLETLKNRVKRNA
jgi:hypothetical protein